MTSAINSGLPTALPATSPTAPHSQPGSNTHVAATASTEAVTLSSDAQTRTQLLDAARIADGAAHPAIAQLRAAIQSNSYNIPPHALAGAIATAMKERQA